VTILGRVRRVTYRFPEQDTGAGVFMAALLALLAPAAGVRVVGASAHLEPTAPAGALPTTTLTLGPITRPEIVFETEQSLDLPLAALLLRSNAARPDDGVPRVVIGSERPLCLPLATIAERLTRHVSHIDHTGVNLPTALVGDEQWENLLRVLAGGAALYRYPGGQPWPFIIPATGEELRDEIRAFPVGRTPKFELVHDALATMPVLQFALGTDLSRGELELRLPEPHGVAFPDLGHIFRAVYVEHPWQGLIIRLDLYYAGPSTAWDTGEWLVASGGRVRHPLSS
jgi:hypothetical protein